MSDIAAITARLDRLPATRTIWNLVILLSLGGVFEFYDLFFTGYVVPGLVRSGLLAHVTVGIFTGPAAFVAATFLGLWIGTLAFGYVADRYGRRTIFTISLLWYCVFTLLMAFATTGAWLLVLRVIAGIGIGVELVTIDTYIAELMPKHLRGRAFAVNQTIQFAVVPVVAFLGWLLVPIAPLGFAGWRWVVLIGSVGAVFVWFIRRGVPESPRWLLQHGQARGGGAGHRHAGEPGRRRSRRRDAAAPARPCRGRHAGPRPLRRDLGAALPLAHHHDDGVPVLPDGGLLRLRELGADADRAEGDQSQHAAWNTPSSSPSPTRSGRCSAPASPTGSSGNG